jgi:hypothetical protein
MVFGDENNSFLPLEGAKQKQKWNGVPILAQMIAFFSILTVLLFLMQTMNEFDHHNPSHIHDRLNNFRKSSESDLNAFELMPISSHDTISSRSSTSSSMDQKQTLFKQKSIQDVNIPHSPLHRVNKDKTSYFANTHDSQRYERISCPDKPPLGYPKTYSIVNITKNWGMDDTNIPSTHYDSLCHFDYYHEYVKAQNYQRAEYVM